MSSFNNFPSNNFAPSAPPLSNLSSSSSSSSSYYYAHPPPQAYGGQFGYSPPGTHPEIVKSFRAVDRDGSGFVDERELQMALSNWYQRFSLSTIRLLMFLFGDPRNPSKIGPAEFATLWNSLEQWRAMFERFDRDRSGEIDSAELRDALMSLGYAVPPSVIHVLVSKYSDGRGGRGSLNFDSFVECGTIVKGLTDKFKEKDKRYTGSTTLMYDEFILMVLPFIVA